MYRTFSPGNLNSPCRPRIPASAPAEARGTHACSRCRTATEERSDVSVSQTRSYTGPRACVQPCACNRLVPESLCSDPQPKHHHRHRHTQDMSPFYCMLFSLSEGWFSHALRQTHTSFSPFKFFSCQQNAHHSCTERHARFTHSASRQKSTHTAAHAKSQSAWICRDTTRDAFSVKQAREINSFPRPDWSKPEYTAPEATNYI